MAGERGPLGRVQPRGGGALAQVGGGGPSLGDPPRGGLAWVEGKLPGGPGPEVGVPQDNNDDTYIHDNKRPSRLRRGLKNENDQRNYTNSDTKTKSSHQMKP